jgi:hypothetical protein
MMRSHRPALAQLDNAVENTGLRIGIHTTIRRNWGDILVGESIVVRAIVASVLLASSANAAALAPKKPSEIVTLMSSTAATCGVGIGQVVDRRIQADGTNVAFGIPAGKVLVVTGIEFTVDPSPMDFVSVGLSHGLTGWSVFLTSATAGIIGPPPVPRLVAAGHAAVPDAVFESGSQICADFSNGILPSPIGTMWVHGFLTKDR